MTKADIKLPPLPDTSYFPDPQWVNYLLRQYADKAIKADRQHREVLAAEVWPEPLSEFSEGQWWVKELDAMKDLHGTSDDQKRAVAVVHHLLASVDRQRRGEPEAFSYELATTRSGDGEYTHWSPRLSYSMPNVPNGSIRNLKWRYAAPQPAEPVSAPKHLIERLQKHCEDKSNTAFSRSTMREALQNQDPLQGAANWLVEAIDNCRPTDIRWRLSIGHNRAQRLHAAAMEQT